MTHVKQVFTLIFVGLFTITLAACSDDNAEQAEDKLDSLKESTSNVFKDAKEAAADATGGGGGGAAKGAAAGA